MRIVVTGASGNVGTPLVRQLLDNEQVTSVVGVARRPPPDGDSRVEWHALDIAENDLTEVVRGADVVVHLAWLLQPAHDPDEMRRVNIGGTQRVLDAIASADVPALIHASSLGTYGPGDKLPRADESHANTGISTSTYSRHKAEAETMLDRFEALHPERRIVRLRPGIVLQARAASELARYFLGPFVPQTLIRRSLLPVVPAVDKLAIQVVHAEDMAAAYLLACLSDVRGAFNIATEPVLDPPMLAKVLGARQVPVPASVARALVDLTWRLHLQPTDPGWVDLGRLTPLMDTTRARTELGWTPAVSAEQALLETVHAMSEGKGGSTPVLRPRAHLPGRLAEVVRAVVPGARGTG